MCVYVYLSSSVGLSIRGDGLQLYLLLLLLLQRRLLIVVTLLGTGQPEKKREEKEILAFSFSPYLLTRIVVSHLSTEV